MKYIIVKFIDPLFGMYVEKLWSMKAFSKERAITKEELFHSGESKLDCDRLQKMLMSGIVKSSEPNKYWLDRKQLFRLDEYCKQRLNNLLISFAIAIIIYTFLNLW